MDMEAISRPLTRKTYTDYIPLVFELLPLLVIAVSLLHSIDIYPKLPDAVPVHFNRYGLTDGWISKNPVTVFGMHLIQAVIYIVLTGVAAAVAKTRTETEEQPFAGGSVGKNRAASLKQNIIIYFFVLKNLILILLGYGVYLSHRIAMGQQDKLGTGFLISVILVLGFAFVGGLLMLIVSVKGEKTYAGDRISDVFSDSPKAAPILPSKGRRERTVSASDESPWKLGVFYYKPDDPRTFVPKRRGPGFTLNLGNKKAVVLLIGAVILILFLYIWPLFHKSPRGL